MTFQSSLDQYIREAITDSTGRDSTVISGLMPYVMDWGIKKDADAVFVCAKEQTHVYCGLAVGRTLLTGAEMWDFFLEFAERNLRIASSFMDWLIQQMEEQLAHKPLHFIAFGLGHEPWHSFRENLSLSYQELRAYSKRPLN